MSTHIVCDQCGSDLRADEELRAGDILECPTCKRSFKYEPARDTAARAKQPIEQDDQPGLVVFFQVFGVANLVGAVAGLLVANYLGDFVWLFTVAGCLISMAFCFGMAGIIELIARAAHDAGRIAELAEQNKGIALRAVDALETSLIQHEATVVELQRVSRTLMAVHNVKEEEEIHEHV